jgi:hypothetical protein
LYSFFISAGVFFQTSFLFSILGESSSIFPDVQVLAKIVCQLLTFGNEVVAQEFTVELFVMKQFELFLMHRITHSSKIIRASSIQIITRALLDISNSLMKK